MEPSRDRTSVDAEWMFHLATACQELVNRTLTADRADFGEALRMFERELPPEGTSLETLFLRDRVMVTAVLAGHRFHRRFHQVVRAPCRRSPVDETIDEWVGNGEMTVRAMLHAWTGAYLEVFDSSHSWPPAVRAAALLRCQFDEPLDLNRVSLHVASARSALIRLFPATYGITMGQYLTRVRLREAIVRLRSPFATVEGVASEVGYKSAKNFYRALRNLTGLTPDGARQLDAGLSCDLLTTALSLPEGVQLDTAFAHGLGSDSPDLRAGRGNPHLKSS
jgi:AraC-like DNA-binding protein